MIFHGSGKTETKRPLKETNQYFSGDYLTARSRFREAVAGAGGRLEAMGLEAQGPNREPLTVDLAWFGSEKPRRAFIHSSGIHGVEGFAGSAIQLQWLHEGIPKLPGDAAIVLAHILNPYGMAWLRRVNENNVDLNRNFIAEGESRDVEAPFAFDKVSPFLNPTSPPSQDMFYLRAIWLLLRHGMKALRDVVAEGQCFNSKGLFFGGDELQKGPARLQSYLATHLSGVKRIVAIDVHTGLGRFGYDRLLVETEPTSRKSKMMQIVFGSRLELTRQWAYIARGAQHSMYEHLFPHSEIYFAVQEFGTYNPLSVLAALRAENRWHHYGAGTVNHPTKAKLRKAFNPDHEKWRGLVLQRGKEVIRQAMLLALGTVTGGTS